MIELLRLHTNTFPVLILPITKEFSIDDAVEYYLIEYGVLPANTRAFNFDECTSQDLINFALDIKP